MPKGLTLLCAAKLHGNQLERHLELFEHIPEVERVLVVRHQPIPERLSKVENRNFAEGTRPQEALRMVSTVHRVIRKEEVDWVLGFNPVPWGSLALLAAKKRKIPTCLSLIGMDFLQIQRPWGRPFLEAVRRADALTVTGTRMLEGLTARGIPSSKIRILPHSVDTTRFVPSDTKREFDLISVGQLIQRKRMDVIIEAVGILAQNGKRLRVGILGEGPLEGALREQASRRGVAEQIEFLGYRDDVQTVLASARAFCLASEWEGLPFAMMEAMSCGLPPLVTDVGTISDWITPGHNGQIFPVGDASALAGHLRMLFFDDENALTRLRNTILSERARLSFESGAQVWRDILNL